MADKPKCWTNLCSAMASAAAEYCPKVEQPNKLWLNTDTKCMELIRRRRKANKSKFQGQEYVEFCKEVKRACRRAKRRWLDSISKDAETAFQTGNTKKAYQLVKQLSGKGGTQPRLALKTKMDR